MPHVGRLQDRVAVVTGSTRGIGRAIAELLAAEGARVVVNARAEEAVSNAAAGIGHGAVGIAADVATPEGCARLIEGTLERHGRIDVLVNNAGASVAGPAEELALADWQRIVDLNLTGPFLLCQHAARSMLAEGRGAIVNIASVAAITTPPRRVSYVAAKAGLIAMTKVLAAEWAPAIRVNAVAPGYFETDLVADLIERGAVDRAALEARSPSGRLGRPVEVARAVAYLVSDEAEFVNGVTLPVDGGWLVYGQNL
ncbi:MAG: glucose 1-dehydrogenase [Actinobacteria bacterium]|nr:glucose 1-dehydrogenase [Actinomycetota bacterium]